MDYFSSRRSCRNFTPEPIETKVLEDIILRAMKAPTCGNMQLYSVIISQNKENLKKLAEFHYNQPASITAPVILTVCADFNRFSHWCKINNAEPGYSNFHSFITAMTDAVIFTQQIATIAEQEGFGTCYLGTVTYNAKQISDLLELPELVVPVASLAIGHIKATGEKTDRLPLESIVHYESYRKDGDENIREFFRIHDENPENDKFLKENNKENLAKVFTDIRYPKDLNERVSISFMEILKEKGFV